MHDNDSERFKIRLEEDDEHEAPQLSELAEDTPSQGGNRAIAIAGLVASLIVGIVAYVLYTDVMRTVEATKSAGKTGVTELSTTVGSRLETLSEQTETLKGTLTADIEALKKRIDPLTREIPALSKKLKKETRALSSLQSSTVVKKELQQKLAVTNEKIDAVKKNLQGVADGLNAVDEKYSREIAVFTQRVKLLDADLKRLNQEAAALKKQSVTADGLAKAIEQVEAKFRRDLQKVSKNLSSEINRRPRPSPPTTGAPADKALPAGASPPSSGAKNSAESDLVEQDITE